MSKRKLTEKQQLVLDLLFTPEIKGNIAVAVREAGYSDSTSVAGVANSIEEELAEATRKFISQSSTKSVYALYEMLLGEGDPLGRKERIAVAKDLLDRAGFAKTDKVEISTVDSLFILPAKDDSE